MKRNIIAILLLLIISFLSCKKDSEHKDPIELQGAVFGTLYTIIYYDQEINFDTEIQQYFAQFSRNLLEFTKKPMAILILRLEIWSTLGVLGLKSS